MSEFGNGADPCSLPTHLAELAFKNFGETDEKRREYLIEMRKQLGAAPETDRLKDLSDSNLIRFLRCRKFDVNRAVEMAIKAKHFYNQHEELFKGMNGEESLDLISEETENFFQVYRNVDAEKRVVIVFRPVRILRTLRSDFGDKWPNGFLRWICYLFHHLVQDPQVQVCGVMMLASFAELSFWECVQFSNVLSITERKIMMTHMQVAGIRIKGMHIFEEPALLTALFFIIKGFLSEKIAARMALHGDDYSIVQRDIAGYEGLPVLFGGKLDDSKAVKENSRQSFGAVYNPGFQWDP
jgi:hypothetical protein